MSGSFKWRTEGGERVAKVIKEVVTAAGQLILLRDVQVPDLGHGLGRPDDMDPDPREHGSSLAERSLVHAVDQPKAGGTGAMFFLQLKRPAAEPFMRDPSAVGACHMHAGIQNLATVASRGSEAAVLAGRRSRSAEASS